MLRRLTSIALLLFVVCIPACRTRSAPAGQGGLVGKPAPAISATTTEGKPFDIASLKGKVVVLDVWATWCGPCRAMIPHEKEMIAKFAGKPFEFVSISADDSTDKLKTFVRANEMNWTHIVDGPNGPIGQAYGVTFYPSIYVVDAEGKVRYQHVRGDDLEHAVEKLLREAGK